MPFSEFKLNFIAFFSSMKKNSWWLCFSVLFFGILFLSISLYQDYQNKSVYFDKSVLEGKILYPYFYENKLVYISDNGIKYFNTDYKIPKNISWAYFERFKLLGGEYYLLPYKSKVGLISKYGDVIFYPKYDSIFRLEQSDFFIVTKKFFGITHYALALNEKRWLLPFQKEMISYGDYPNTFKIGNSHEYLTFSRDYKLIPYVEKEYNNFNIKNDSNNVELKTNEGDEIKLDNISFLKDLKNGMFLFMDKASSKMGVMDYRRKIIIPPYFQSIDVINNKYIKVQYQDKYGLFSTSGNLIIEAVFDNIFVGKSDYAVITYKNKEGIFDLANEKMLLLPVFKSVKINDDGFALISKEGNFKTSSGYKNEKFAYFSLENNKFITDFIFDTGYSFSGNLARICIDDKYGFIDKNGILKILPIYIYALDFNGNLALVKDENNEVYYIYSSNGGRVNVY